MSILHKPLEEAINPEAFARRNFLTDRIGNVLLAAHNQGFHIEVLAVQPGQYDDLKSSLTQTAGEDGLIYFSPGGITKITTNE